MLAIGSKAPEFELPDQEGNVHSLSDYRGSWVVLYFYPRDNTPGCTKEACNFRDSYQEFLKKGYKIVGVSKDSVASHKKFAEKHHLMSPLLADVNKEVITAYNAWGQKKFMGKTFEGTLRVTYLINPEGVIEKAFAKVNPLTHAQEILS